MALDHSLGNRWIDVGIVVSEGALATVITDPRTIGREHISGILVGSLISASIISLGLCISIVKIVAEAALEEVKK